MGSSDGETIAAPAPSQNGGSRSECRQTAGQVVPSICLRSGKNSTQRQTHGRRERMLDSVALIGQGSDALVYLVRSKLTGRMSALKVGAYAGRAARGRGGTNARNGSKQQTTLRFFCYCLHHRRCIYMWFPDYVRDACVEVASRYALSLCLSQGLQVTALFCLETYECQLHALLAGGSRGGVRVKHPA